VVIREAGPADRALVEALLSRAIDMAMFPLANLRAQGLVQGGFPSDHSHACRFWLVGTQGLVALSRGGMLMPHLTEGCDLTALRAALACQRVAGALGSASAVRPVMAALGLDAALTRKDEDEPAFALDLDHLRIPDVPGARLIAAAAAYRPLLTEWRTAYHRESLNTPTDHAAMLALVDVDRMIDRGNHRLLMVEGQPVALTGFNATLPQIVQVGGVYTPPALRGRGHARLAVALHLAEARAAGVARAVLFAAGPAAARAYAAIGFQPNGSFALVLFAAPVTIPA
jgi:GNAT superfamily N-acetyltransferase